MPEYLHTPQVGLGKPTKPEDEKQRPINALSSGAIVLGIGAFVADLVQPFFGLFLGLVAIVLGAVGLTRSDGKGMAAAGLALGSINTLLLLLVFAFGVSFLAPSLFFLSGSVHEGNHIATSPIENESKIGTSRLTPAPIGTTMFIKRSSPFEYYEARITLVSVLSGEEAWKLVHKANQFNEPPASGYEYMLAKIQVEYIKGTDGDTIYSIDEYDFSAVSGAGLEYENPGVVEPDPSVEARLYPGARHAGWVVLQVKKYDRPLLTFGRDFNGTGGIWFKLYH